MKFEIFYSKIGTNPPTIFFSKIFSDSHDLSGFSGNFRSFALMYFNQKILLKISFCEFFPHFLFSDEIQKMNEKKSFLKIFQGKIKDLIIPNPDNNLEELAFHEYVLRFRNIFSKKIPKALKILHNSYN